MYTAFNRNTTVSALKCMVDNTNFLKERKSLNIQDGVSKANEKGD